MSDDDGSMVQTSTHPWHGWIVEVACTCGETIPVVSKSIRMSPAERKVIEAAKALIATRFSQKDFSKAWWVFKKAVDALEAKEE